MNKILLILPTINEERTLKFYEQILRTKLELDILIIDDGSFDNTLSIIDDLKKNLKKTNFL